MTPVTTESGMSILSAADLHSEPVLFMMVYGPWGSGKTTLAASLADSPYGQPLLLVSADLKGTESICHRDDIHICEPKSYKELMSFLRNDLGSGRLHFKSIVFDTITDIQRLFVEHAQQIPRKGGGTRSRPDKGDYLWSHLHTVEMVRMLRAWGIQTGTHIVFTAQETEQTDAVGDVIKIRPALSRKAADIVCAAVSQLGHLVVSTRGGERLRQLTFDPSYLTQAKFRQPAKDPTVPSTIDLPIEAIDSRRYGLAYILDLLHGDEVRDLSSPQP